MRLLHHGQKPKASPTGRIYVRNLNQDQKSGWQSGGVRIQPTVLVVVVVADGETAGARGDALARGANHSGHFEATSSAGVVPVFYRRERYDFGGQNSA